MAADSTFLFIGCFLLGGCCGYAAARRNKLWCVAEQFTHIVNMGFAGMGSSMFAWWMLDDDNGRLFAFCYFVSIIVGLCGQDSLVAILEVIKRGATGFIQSRFPNSKGD